MLLFCLWSSADLLQVAHICVKSKYLRNCFQGMSYIHNSSLGSHGRLKSSNCLVDNRWVLKVTDYGIGRFISNKKTGETQQYYKGRNDFTWTSMVKLCFFLVILIVCIQLLTCLKHIVLPIIEAKGCGHKFSQLRFGNSPKHLQSTMPSIYLQGVYTQ